MMEVEDKKPGLLVERLANGWRRCNIALHRRWREPEFHFARRLMIRLVVFSGCFARGFFVSACRNFVISS